MKTIRIITAISIAVMFAIFTMNFKTKNSSVYKPTGIRQELLIKTWVLNRYFIDGEEAVKGSYKTTGTYSETYYRDGTFRFSFTNKDMELMNSVGTWEFQNSENDMIRNSTSGEPIFNGPVQILRVSDDQFWYSYTEDNQRKEYHFVPQRKRDLPN